ncbi:hypothetical protein [Bradyrhizobium sp. CCBAU 45384]|uniref:hypothetical protein n=1 Tax=Bradyrhizobium sp. CCBAU 45384 TaxID=858428 RepID=UPI00230599F5|nr:hypothetical protein [Bradyrhizobium sp. CCBAU 45384]
MATERAFVADHVRLGFATRARHDELPNPGRLRRHGGEAEDRAAAARMPVAGSILVVITIPGHRNVMRMNRRSDRVVMPV